MVRAAGAVRGPRAAIVDAVLRAGAAEAVWRAAVAEAAALARHAGRTRPVRRHGARRDGRDAHGVVQPEVAAVVVQVGVVLLEVVKGQAVALADGRTVVAGLD